MPGAGEYDWGARAAVDLANPFGFAAGKGGFVYLDNHSLPVAALKDRVIGEGSCDCDVACDCDATDDCGMAEK